MNIINAVYESNRKLTLDNDYAGTQADHNSTEIKFTIPVELDGFSMRISWDVYIEDLDGNFGQPIETVLNKSYLIPNAILHATSNGVVRFQILFVNDEDEIVEASELTKLRVSPATPGVSLPSLNVGYINFYRLLDKAITGVYWDELNLTFDTIKGDTQTVTVPWEKVSGDMENNIDLWNYLGKIATSLPYNPDQMTDAKFVRWSNGKAITKDIEVNDVKTLFDKLATINSRIDGLNGAYVIVGRINSTYPTAVELNDRVMELKEEPPRVGWVLIDSLNNEWYWNNGWDNLGMFLLADATSTSAGILKLHNSTSTATDGTWTARLIKAEMDKRATLNAEGTLVQNLNSPLKTGMTLTALFNGVTNNSFATITTRDNDIGSPFGTSGVRVNLHISKRDANTGTIIAMTEGSSPRMAMITLVAGAWSDWRHVIHTDTWSADAVPVTGLEKGLMAYSSITKVQLETLSGIASNVQTQLNSKETPSGAQTKATTALNDAKSYVNGKVKTDVPVGAVFTDTPTDISGKVDKVTGKELSTNDYTTNEKNKLSGIDAEANKYVHPTSHPASIITQSSTARFVTDTEKSTWNGKVNQSQVLTNVPANAVFTDTPTDISGKVDKITGMGLSTNDYTSVEKAKLGGLHTVATSGKYTDLSSLPTLGTASSKNTGTGSGNIPILDSGGKLDALIIPALAISETFIVATQSAMLGLTAQTGDICIRTDLSNSFILSQSPSSTLANWKELLTPSSAVQSVAGKVGVVTLGRSDVGLGNVDNTTDATKPVSSAQQTALNLKADKTQVLTNVPANAIFTDTKYTHPANHPPSIISQDTNNRFVTDAEKTAWNGKETPANAQVKATTALNDAKTYVDGKVLTDVPTGAIFTDTKYTHPATHPSSIISQTASARFVTDTEKGYWNAKADMSDIPDISGKVDITYVDNKVKTDVPANAVFTDTPTDISGKVDKVAGKGLSTNDYTTAEKTKLGNLPKIWIGEEANKDTATDTLYFCYE